MQSYDISNKKEFMSKLLKSHLFDSFEVREIILHTAFKMILEGKRNTDYFEQSQETSRPLYLSWSEMQKNVYELIQGRRQPTYFKIILSTPLDKTLSLSEEADACYLNVQFKDNKLTCSTGISYKQFTLNQEPDKIWDEEIKNFLFNNHFM
jgi:hypothetical protein